MYKAGEDRVRPHICSVQLHIHRDAQRPMPAITCRNWPKFCIQPYLRTSPSLDRDQLSRGASHSMGVPHFRMSSSSVLGTFLNIRDQGSQIITSKGPCSPSQPYNGLDNSLCVSQRFCPQSLPTTISYHKARAICSKLILRTYRKN